MSSLKQTSSILSFRETSSTVWKREIPNKKKNNTIQYTVWILKSYHTKQINVQSRASRFQERNVGVCKLIQRTWLYIWL